MRESGKGDTLAAAPPVSRLPTLAGLALVAAGAITALLTLAAMALAPLVDLDGYRPRVEAAASRALAMDVTIEGPLRVAFHPGLHLSMEQVRIRHRGSQVLFAERADVAVDLLPLLQRRLHYDRITLDRARVSIERGTDGRYNLQKPAGEVTDFPGMDLPRLVIPVLAVDYADRLTGDALASADCKAELADLRHPGGGPFLARLSVAGRLTCGELRGRDSTITDLRLTLAATDGVYDFKPVTMRAFGGEGSGRLHMDRTAAVPVLRLEFALAKFRIEEFFRGLPPVKSVSGAMDFATTLELRGRTRAELRRSATGTMSLSGTDLRLDGADLDDQLAHFEASQAFNLADMTAFFLAGPVGVAVTKGAQFASLAQAKGGHTPIRRVVSRWKVDRGVAQAVDVALATGTHRLALRGGLDFVDEAFDEVVVSLVGADGCARARQRIRGPFAKPVVEKPDVLVSAAGPVLALIAKARSLLAGKTAACEVVYAGVVAPPAGEGPGTGASARP